MSAGEETGSAREDTSERYQGMIVYKYGVLFSLSFSFLVQIVAENWTADGRRVSTTGPCPPGCQKVRAHRARSRVLRASRHKRKW